MSWGPNDDLDMWFKKKEQLVDPKAAKLSYGPHVRLAVELTDKGWIWAELDIDGKVTTHRHNKHFVVQKEERGLIARPERANWG